MTPEKEHLLRVRAITHVESLALGSPEGLLSWAQIASGFDFEGAHVDLATKPRGIFWPAPLTVGALSVKTTIPRRGRAARYDDQIGGDAPYFEYRYQGDDPDRRDNVRLRQCLTHALPVIYFYGVSEALYRPLICFVLGEDPARRTFFVATMSEAQAAVNPVLRQAAVVRFERRYSMAEVRRRLHQDRFRSAVMSAYQERCAVCSLRRVELLDAAHIIPDRDKRGEAMVPNGLALCKLHHSAYDANVLGIDQDRRIHLRRDVLEEVDGPLLEHGLKDFHRVMLRVVPHAANDQPDRELLAERFEHFKKAAGQ
jgi:putative restriction endonuclease